MSLPCFHHFRQTIGYLLLSFKLEYKRTAVCLESIWAFLEVRFDCSWLIVVALLGRRCFFGRFMVYYKSQVEEFGLLKGLMCLVCLQGVDS